MPSTQRECRGASRGAICPGHDPSQPPQQRCRCGRSEPVRSLSCVHELQRRLQSLFSWSHLDAAVRGEFGKSPVTPTPSFWAEAPCAAKARACSLPWCAGRSGTIGRCFAMWPPLMSLSRCRSLRSFVWPTLSFGAMLSLLCLGDAVGQAVRTVWALAHNSLTRLRVHPIYVEHFELVRSPSCSEDLAWFVFATSRGTREAARCRRPMHLRRKPLPMAGA